MKTVLHLIYVLWTGEGMWGWVRPWLPWLFRIPVPVLGAAAASIESTGRRRIGGATPCAAAAWWITAGWACAGAWCHRRQLRIGGVAFPRELESLHLLGERGHRSG